MALSRLVRSQKKTSSATELIEQAMRRAVEEFPPLKHDDWIRISSLGALCPREEVLRSRLNVSKSSGVDPEAGITFEFGHSIHWIMQNKVMAATGKIVGSWRCTWCGEIYGSIRGDGLLARPERCVRCGAVAGDVPRVSNRPVEGVRGNAFLYVEEWLGNTEYMVGGSPDGYMVDGDPASFKNDDVIILEFKSASENNFAKYKKAPDFMHVVQCQCYMWITGFRRSKIIYVNKGEFGMSGLVEHDQTYDEEAISLIKSGISQIRSGIAGGVLPRREMCGSDSCPRARMCDVRKTCFELESP